MMEDLLISTFVRCAYPGGLHICKSMCVYGVVEIEVGVEDGTTEATRSGWQLESLSRDRRFPLHRDEYPTYRTILSRERQMSWLGIIFQNQAYSYHEETTKSLSHFAGRYVSSLLLVLTCGSLGIAYCSHGACHLSTSVAFHGAVFAIGNMR